MAIENDVAARPRRLTTCSFCGKSNQQTGAHAEGPHNVYICEECAYLTLGICRKEREKVSAARRDPER